jgi:hypothetical protein
LSRPYRIQEFGAAERWFDLARIADVFLNIDGRQGRFLREIAGFPSIIQRQLSSDAAFHLRQRQAPVVKRVDPPHLLCIETDIDSASYD